MSRLLGDTRFRAPLFFRASSFWDVACCSLNFRNLPRCPLNAALYCCDGSYHLRAFTKYFREWLLQTSWLPTVPTLCRFNLGFSGEFLPKDSGRFLPPFSMIMTDELNLRGSFSWCFCFRRPSRTATLFLSLWHSSSCPRWLNHSPACFALVSVMVLDCAAVYHRNSTTNKVPFSRCLSTFVTAVLHVLAEPRNLTCAASVLWLLLLSMNAGSSLLPPWYSTSSRLGLGKLIEAAKQDASQWLFWISTFNIPATNLPLNASSRDTLK